MIKQNLTNNYTWVFVFVLLLCGFKVGSVFAQCNGVNFNNTYRHISSSDNYNLRLNDWNGDGKLDLWKAVPNVNATTIDIVIYALNSNSDWNWNAPIIYQTPIAVGNSNNLNIQDFDSDGDKDILIGGFPLTTTIYRNNANGTFTQLTTFFLYLMKTATFTPPNQLI
jgi:FG-GAP-like repeat